MGEKAKLIKATCEHCKVASEFKVISYRSPIHGKMARVAEQCCPVCEKKFTAIRMVKTDDGHGGEKRRYFVK